MANSICQVNGKTSEALDDLDHVDISTSCSSGGDNCKSDNIDSNVLDIVCALVSCICAESTAVRFSCWALLPADWTVSTIAIFARRITEETTHFKSLLAGEDLTYSSSIGILST